MKGGGSDQAVNLYDLVQDFRKVNLQINQLACAYIENPAVHLQLTLPISLLNGCCFDEVNALLLHIQLHESVVAGTVIASK